MSKIEKTLVALGDDELSTVAGGDFDMNLVFAPKTAVAHADRGSQATANAGDAAVLAPVYNKQSVDIFAAIGNLVPGLVPVP